MIWGKEYRWAGRRFVLLESHYATMGAPRQFVLTKMLPGEIMIFDSIIPKVGIRAICQHGEIIFLNPISYRIKWEILNDT
jgi:hypothetical protein